MIRRPPRSTQSRSSAASDVYKRQSQASDPGRDALTRSFNLAEELGGKVVILPGTRIADTVLDFAHDKNVTLIIVGLSHRSRWHEFQQSSATADITGKAGPIHV